MAYTTINKSSLHQNTVLYNSNGTAIGSGGLTVTGFDFQPDWLGIKVRDQSESWGTYDAVRGVTKSMRFNGSDTEDTRTEGVTTFNSSGFICGNDSRINPSGTHPCLAYGWKANGAGSANTDGTITSTVSANTTSGFSIVKYDGSGSGSGTVGHGLSVKPRLLIVKSSTHAENWNVWFDTTGNDTADKRLVLSGTAADYGNYFASFQNTTFTLPSHNDGGWSGSGKTYIAYCFAEKTGYSKFGSYTGNGNNNGTFVYTGFKPKFLMIKRTDSSDNWVIFDDSRLGYNDANYRLYSNLSAAEEGGGKLDILSNGFKTRANWTTANASGGTHIYMAFGQSIVGTNNIPATAR